MTLHLIHHSLQNVLRALPIALLVASLVGVASCTPDDLPQRQVSRFAMGTMVDYTIVAESDAASRRAIEAAHKEIEHVSSLLWEEDSVSSIYRFNRIPDTMRASDEVASFLRRSRRYHLNTRGAFDITIRPVLSLYPFGTEDPRPPTYGELSAAMRNVDMTAWSVDASGLATKSRQEISLAVGGVAKGYAVDRAVAVLRQMGVQNAVVNAGGDLYCLGTNHGTPWRVGVRDPDDAGGVIKVLHVVDAGVATSGDYQQYFDHDGVRYHHILDPETGRPARKVRSATVIAPTTEEADALATAAFVLGPVDGISLLDSLGAEGLLVDSTGAIYSTPGLDAYLRDGN